MQRFLTRWRWGTQLNAPRGHSLRGWAALSRGIMGSFTGRTAVLPPSVASETALTRPFRLERAIIDVLRRQRADSSLAVEAAPTAPAALACAQRQAQGVTTGGCASCCAAAVPRHAKLARHPFTPFARRIMNTTTQRLLRSYQLWTAQIHQIYPPWPPKRFRSDFPGDEAGSETNDGDT